jgi:hypothetical protein
VDIAAVSRKVARPELLAVAQNIANHPVTRIRRHMPVTILGNVQRAARRELHPASLAKVVEK